MRGLHRCVSSRFLVVFFGILLAGSATCGAQGKTVESQPEPIHWQHGPIVAQLGTGAQIKVPAGYQFADAAGARRFLELTHNPPSEQEAGIVTPILGKDDPDSKFWLCCSISTKPGT